MNEIQAFVESLPSPGTRRVYAGALADFARTLAISSSEALLAVGPDDVVRYRNDLQRRKLGASTINLRLAAVRGLFTRLLKERRIDGNPADPDLVPGLPVSDESRTEGLSLEEVKEILDTCDGTLAGLRDRALIVTLYYEGLRRSEASKLNWRDITTRRGLVEIRDAKNNPYATVRLRAEVLSAIRDYHEVLNRELRRRATRPEDPVFTSLSPIRSFGRRLSDSAINAIVKARARAAGIERRITAHSWRHTCTTHALGAGAALHQVQRHLRHRDVRTTLRYDRDRDVRRNPTGELLPRLG
ncbi:MAG: tyrosine-type recombinase/integrase [Planctomycetes bacterium]|nr:tyrosine-type recombinase/integrase [Planctomycetota bacterium]